VIKLGRLKPITVRNCLLVELRTCLRMKFVIISVVLVILSVLRYQLTVRPRRNVVLHLLNSRIMMLPIKHLLNLELLLLILK